MNYVSVLTNYKLLRTFTLTRHSAVISWIFPFMYETHTEENYKLQSSLTFTNQHSNYIARYLTAQGNMRREFLFSPLPLNSSQFFYNLKTA